MRFQLRLGLSGSAPHFAGAGCRDERCTKLTGRQKKDVLEIRLDEFYSYIIAVNK